MLVGDEEADLIQDGEQKTRTLKDLLPNSKYKIAISVLTKAGESQQSTPRIWLTSEAGMIFLYRSERPLIVVDIIGNGLESRLLQLLLMHRC